MTDTYARVTPLRVFFGGLAVMFYGVVATRYLFGLIGITAMIFGACWLVLRLLRARVGSHTADDGFVRRPPMWHGQDDPRGVGLKQPARLVDTVAYDLPRPPSFTWKAPPDWPQPPSGWTPPPGWEADPAWGAAPPGWQFWVPATATVGAHGRGGPAAAHATGLPLHSGSPRARTSEDHRKWLIWAVVGGVILLFAAPWSSEPNYEVANDEALQALDAAMREANPDARWLENMKRVTVGIGENIDVYTSVDGQVSGSGATAIAICEAYTAASPVPGPRVMVWGEKPSFKVDGSDSRGDTKLASSGGNALASAAVDDCDEITDLTDPDRSGG